MKCKFRSICLKDKEEGMLYEIIDDIPIMLIDEAKLYDGSIKLKENV